MNILKSLVKGKTLAAEIRAELDKASKALADAQAAYDASLVDYKTSLTDADEEATFKALARRDRAKVGLERAETLVSELTAAIEAAELKERNDAKVARYHEAAKRSADLAKTLPDRYRKIGADVRLMLRELDDADKLVAAVNADLPEGFERLTPPESLVRFRPPEEEAVVSEKRIDWWFYEDTDNPIPESEWSSIVNKNDQGNRGSLLSNSSWGAGSTVVLKPALVREVRPSSAGNWFDPLARTINLPALCPGDAPEWSMARRGDAAEQVAWRERVISEAAERRAAPPETVKTIVAL